MVHSITGVSDFSTWRVKARELVIAGVRPEEICWSDGQLLLADTAPVGAGLRPAPTATPSEHNGTAIAEPAPPSQTPSPPDTKARAGLRPAPTSPTEQARVPREFLSIAQRVACARTEEKWSLLYRVLWRLTNGEPHLLQISIDDDIHALTTLDKAVRRDAHKMKAFVRFRKVESSEGEHYIAWHRPDHLIIRLTAPFFADRFGTLRWTIFTPDASVAWDGEKLTYGAGIPQSRAPAEDALEDYWRAYYGAIFNPARIKLRAMRREMPVRHWATLPETEIIDQLLREAPQRVETMIATARSTKPATAAPFIPTSRSLPVLASAAATCKGCPLHCNATQTVFGQGPAAATCMFVGEQPGDQEDRAGVPFVGPAGQVLNQALLEAGIARESLYLTNAVKHFKWEPRGTRRIHAKPVAREISACRPWLEAEIEAVKPQMIVCLGVTAAQSLLGAGFRLHQHRGQPITDTRWAPWLLTTIHPSFLLRIPDPAAAAQARSEFIRDLRLVSRRLAECESAG